MGRPRMGMGAGSTAGGILGMGRLCNTGRPGSLGGTVVVAAPRPAPGLIRQLEGR